MSAFRILPLLLLAALPAVAAKAPSESSLSGTYRGRVLTERFRHEQALSRRRAALRAEQVAPPRQDQGEIAVMEASDFIIAPLNLFDLQGITLRFTPSASGYASAPEALAFDESARANGVSLALDDDDTTRVDLEFSFPYFGSQYSAVWVNSDGNLTFGEGDGLVAARSVARAVAGPPRIAPLFADLDPSRPAARVRVDSRVDRVFVTWDGVPQYTDAGNGRRQIFQVELSADGGIAFHYLSATLNEVTTGVFPGRLAGQPDAVDFSSGPAGPSTGGLAELFQLVPDLDINAVSQQFYRTHDDVYDFLVVFNALGLSAGATAFAYEVNVRNEVLGIGDLLSSEPVFDFGEDFGSPKRLASFLNMGPLSNYPSDPTTVIPLIGENSTLSVMGQEAGHRWGVYLEYINPATGLPSTNLLGRDDAHWNFFFNSQASVLEGNEIVDHGEAASPRFETVDAVARYGELDQYIMGLRAPEEVAPELRRAQPAQCRQHQPQPAPRLACFDGDRQDITIDLIEAAEGPRTPDHTVAQREIRFAFILLVAQGASPARRTSRSSIVFAANGRATFTKPSTSARSRKPRSCEASAQRRARGRCAAGLGRAGRAPARHAARRRPDRQPDCRGHAIAALGYRHHPCRSDIGDVRRKRRRAQSACCVASAGGRVRRTGGAHPNPRRCGWSSHLCRERRRSGRRVAESRCLHL
ncbi:MAG: hypothetical protein R2748_01045 [Bryobacterales bacterium]